MKLDLRYEMGTLAPHHERSGCGSYWQAMEQAELAERYVISHCSR